MKSKNILESRIGTAILAISVTVLLGFFGCETSIGSVGASNTPTVEESTGPHTDVSGDQIVEIPITSGLGPSKPNPDRPWECR